jgi:hypothetical protein
VERLNANKPDGYCDVQLKWNVTTKKGQIVPHSGYVAIKDVYSYRIVATTAGTKWCPLRDVLNDLSIFNSMAFGIPDLYMNSGPNDRLAVIAGLIESDGIDK